MYKGDYHLSKRICKTIGHVYGEKRIQLFRYYNPVCGDVGTFSRTIKKCKTCDNHYFIEKFIQD